MSERLSAEERAKVERRIAVYLASEETTGSPDTTPFPERARDIYENFIMPAEKAAAEAERFKINGRWMAALTKYTEFILLKGDEVEQCVDKYIPALLADERSSLLEPITDKSICQRGHKQANVTEPGFVCTHCNNAGRLSECLSAPAIKLSGPTCPRCRYCVQVLPPKCSACTQLEAELNNTWKEAIEAAASYLETHKRPLLAEEMARHLAYQIRNLRRNRG